MTSRRFWPRLRRNERSFPAAEANVATFEANIEQDKVNAAAPDLPMYKAPSIATSRWRKKASSASKPSTMPTRTTWQP